MGDMRVITPSERNVLHRAESSAMRFKIRVPLPGLGPALTFTAKDSPFLELYKIVIGRQTKVVNMTAEEQHVTSFSLNNIDFQLYQEFWITWYNKKIKMGVWQEKKPFLVYKMLTEHEVGYIQFNTVSQNWAPVEWIIETSPVNLNIMASKEFKDAELCWKPLQAGKLPVNAMIGGLENELTYVARSQHNNTMCPGKYVPSTGRAYVAWGSSAYAKRNFEILCGYNAIWVKAKLNCIPTNAFVGGETEDHEPLFIGRAMHEGKLIVGKVHARYKKCYLPDNDKEIEKSSYEILVIPNTDIPQAIYLDAYQ